MAADRPAGRATCSDARWEHSRQGAFKQHQVDPQVLGPPCYDKLAAC